MTDPATDADRPSSLGRPGGVIARLGVGRQALRDGASGLGIEAAQLVGTFLFFALVSRRLGPTDYGSFAAMYSLIGVSLALAHVGPGLAFLQHAVDSPDLGVKKVSPGFFSIYLALVGASVVIVLGLSPLLLPDLSIGTVALFMVAELFGATLVQIARTLRLIVSGFSATVSLQLLLVGVKTAVVVALFVADRLTLRSYGVVYAICCVLIGLVVFAKVTGSLHVPRRLGRPRREHVGTTLTISSTVWVFNLHNDGDKLTMSARNLGADVGLYAAAYRMVMLAVIPINALVTSSYRTFVDPSVGNHLRRAAKYTLATTVYCTIAAAVLIVAAPVAIPLVVGDGFSGAVSMTRWLAPLMIVRGLTHFPMSALMGLGHARARLWCISVSAAVAMVLYVTLIPSMSWKGAIIGSYCSDAVLAVASWWTLWRLRGVRGAPESAAVAYAETREPE